MHDAATEVGRPSDMRSLERESISSLAVTKQQSTGRRSRVIKCETTTHQQRTNQKNIQERATQSKRAQIHEHSVRPQRVGHPCHQKIRQATNYLEDGKRNPQQRLRAEKRTTNASGMVGGHGQEQRVPGNDLASSKGPIIGRTTNNLYRKGVLEMGISTGLRRTPERYRVMVPGGSMAPATPDLFPVSGRT